MEIILGMQESRECGNDDGDGVELRSLHTCTNLISYNMYMDEM